MTFWVSTDSLRRPPSTSGRGSGGLLQETPARTVNAATPKIAAVRQHPAECRSTRFMTSLPRARWIELVWGETSCIPQWLPGAIIVSRGPRGRPSARTDRDDLGRLAVPIHV